jgi:hypothetical protein
MTDNLDGPSGAPPWPTVSSNIRAEAARRGMSLAQLREAMPEQVRPSASTFADRLAKPGTWRIREVEAIARILGVATSVLFSDVPAVRRG